MKASREGTILLTMTIAVFIFGCTTADVSTLREAQMVRQQDPTGSIRAVLADLQAAYRAGDVDGIVAVYSDDYIHANGTDKSGVQSYFKGLSASGALQNIIFGIEECEIVIDGDSATAGPVTHDSPASSGEPVRAEPMGAADEIEQARAFVPDAMVAMSKMRTSRGSVTPPT